MTESSSWSPLILVADDSPQNRLVAEGQLTPCGYRVITAADGTTAIELFRKEAPDLVLLDVLMPGLDGFETCRRIRELPRGQDVPIVFITALGDLETQRVALESGADDFLGKPVQRTELLMRVRSLLRITELQAERRKDAELLRAQRDALLKAKRRNEELAELIVHDLRNPLASILANLQFTLASGQLGGEPAEALKDSVHASEALHRMILNLLDMSRSDDAGLRMQTAHLDLLRIAREVRDQVHHRSQQDGKTVVVATDHQTVGLHGDPVILRRVVENLIDNSIKYTPSGGTITIELSQAADRSALLKVRDQGPGVPEAYRESVFDKYAQLDRDAARRARSSRGLGLAFCRLAVEAHGGRIWIEDNEPRGAVFCISLPPDAPTAAPNQPEARPSGADPS
jgi:two-component system sensor histidine kinase/response regulator